MLGDWQNEKVANLLANASNVVFVMWDLRVGGSSKELVNRQKICVHKLIRNPFVTNALGVGEVCAGCACENHLADWVSCSNG